MFFLCGFLHSPTQSLHSPSQSVETRSASVHSCSRNAEHVRGVEALQALWR